ncbi:MAG: hypothetical protein WCO60_19775 [Verrucomicrobiota bacterium]
MDQIISLILAKFADQALPTLMLVIALVWLHKSNNTLINALNEERRQRIDHLEKSSLDCIKDRTELHNENKELWDRFLDHVSKENSRHAS